MRRDRAGEGAQASKTAQSDDESSRGPLQRQTTLHDGTNVSGVGNKFEEDRFAAALMQIRDQAIHDCDLRATGQVGAGEEPWHTVVQSPDVQRAVDAVIPEIVDQVLFLLLHATDNEDLPLAWRTSDGRWESLDDLSTGGMAGSFIAFWRDEFCAQRFHGLRIDESP